VFYNSYCLYYILGGQAYIVALWTGTKYMQPAMQAAHMLWCVGSAICPLIVQPFLTPQISETELNDTSRNITGITPGPTVYSYTGLTGYGKNTTDVYGVKDKIAIHYAYMIVGFVCIVTSALFMVNYIHEPTSFCTKKMKWKEQQTGKSKNSTKNSQKFRLKLLSILFFFFATYAWVESVLGSFVATFVVEGLKWEKYKGALITTVMWGSMGVGRLLGVPFSVLFTPRQMAYTDTVLTTFAIGIMLLSSYASDILMWIGAAMVGLAMGTTFASVILWAEAYIEIDGQAGGLFLVGSSSGGMSGPAIVGVLFQSLSHMWLIYFTLGSSLLNILCLLLADVVASRYKKYVESKNTDKQTAPEMKPDVEMELL
jgi:FHS family Na+ dependent glucose MFS transporter 1